MQKCKTFLDLPVDVVQLIALKTESIKDYLNIALVCKHFNGILKQTKDHPRRTKAQRYFTKMTSDQNGTISWKLNGRLHNFDDKPAYIQKFERERKAWYRYGLRHRDNDKPAYIQSDGYKSWWKNDVRHRECDKPAIVRPNGTKEWFINGVRDRENDKPAMIRSDGTKEWFLNGVRDRECDKPAIVRPNGTKEWWINGKYIHTKHKYEIELLKK